jgi:hypothetical protein
MPGIRPGMAGNFLLSGQKKVTKEEALTQHPIRLPLSEVFLLIGSTGAAGDRPLPMTQFNQSSRG